jgi:voltage-gated potassium channel
MPASVLQRPEGNGPSLVRLLRHPVTDAVVFVLIVVSVALIGIEEVRGLPPNSWVARAGDAITWFFVVELSLRFAAARKKSRFFRRYWPDILAVLPLLRPLRFFRALKLLRLFRLFQLGMILDRRFAALQGVLRVNVPFLWIILVVTLLAVVGGTVVAFSVEGRVGADFDTAEESFWWVTYSLIAGEPVGGMPRTVPGRALLVTLMLGGSAIFAGFTGLVSATMVDRLQTMSRVAEMDLDELEEQIVICGWNDGARPLLTELVQDRNLKNLPIVLVNELDHLPSEIWRDLQPDLVYHLQGDFAQLEMLRQAGIERASRAVVLADEGGPHSSVDRDARSVLTALTIERLNPDIYCVVELNHDANRAHLAVAGVEAVITGSDLTGRALAAACRDSAATQALMDLLSLQTGAQVEPRPGPKVGMTFEELVLQVKRTEGLLVIGVDRPGEGCVLNPPSDAWVSPADRVVVIRGRH